MPTAAERFTDLATDQDTEGMFDLMIDETTADFVLTGGLETAIVVSLFSDRRARSDEVADPMKRRGWDGDLVPDVPGDVHGSGLWLYEQRRLGPGDYNGVRMEAEAALAWMVGEGLARTAVAAVTPVPVKRQLQLAVRLTEPDGGVTSKAYVLADATRTGMIAKL